MCLFVCLCSCLCPSLSLFWATTFEVIYIENSFFDFDVNLDGFYTKTCLWTHTYTQTTYMHNLKKKGNFLLFGIAIVFQIVDLIFGRLIQVSPNISQDMLGLVVLLVQMYPRIFRDIYELKAEHIIQSNTYNSAIGYILSTSLNTASMYLRFWTEV